MIRLLTALMYLFVCFIVPHVGDVLDALVCPFRMTQKWLGYLLSIDCGGDLGRFQGRVSHIDSGRQNLVLKNVTKNGITCGADSITVK